MATGEVLVPPFETLAALAPQGEAICPTRSKSLYRERPRAVTGQMSTSVSPFTTW